MKHKFFLFSFVFGLTQLYAQTIAKPPMPLLPIPTARQLEWQKSELIMFLHFGVNTFTNREWGMGTESPAIFVPEKLDALQWARTAKETGFQTLILTAKHHDGFCLWPSRYTRHSVASSPWRQGRGNVVAELSAACKKQGLKMGLYLSPWDRHEPSYGQGTAYNQHYIGQLTELLTQYGPVHEIWFDGACGEGPNGKKQVYDFIAFWALVRQFQPAAVMFSDAGPDVRWIGNENGHAGETCWSMMDKTKVTIGGSQQAYLNSGDSQGSDWIPGECDVSIRKGWFWHPEENPKTVDELLDIYFKSVGRNSVLLLNVPPNRDGLLDNKDVIALKSFRQRLDAIFSNNLATGASAQASNIRGNDPGYAAGQTLDERQDTFWASDDSVNSATLELELPASRIFNIVCLREPVSLGQRIEKYRVEAWLDGAWKTISQGTTIGNKKLDRVGRTQTDKIRIVLEESRACPLLSQVELYWDKEQ